jgi:NADH:ubiquinone oxidoreductase subunit F (NADH-binding)
MIDEMRVLDPLPVTSLRDDKERGDGLRAFEKLGPDGVIASVRAAGLRGRGGAGFPTAIKWRTVRENLPPRRAPTVVVNGAEGEPGTYKDRTILLTNPYRVIEGAAIAAHAIGADRIVFALKESFVGVHDRVKSAVAEMDQAGWLPDFDVDVVLGPSSYLYGEETALLEVANGRPPFPQVAPPYRRGVDVLSEDVTSEAASVELAGPAAETGAAPTLVDNVETIANIAGIVARGPEWFRSVGTDRSPGTVVCTISGATKRAGVAEIPLGFVLEEAIQLIGDGLPTGRRIKFCLPGVSAGIIPGHNVDVPLTHDALSALGSGLGTAGFIVFDDRADAVAVAQAVSRFLAVESCGQCTPCKGDGLEIAARLARLRDGDAETDDLAALEHLIAHIDLGARCFLGRQHREVIESLLLLQLADFERHAEGTSAEPVLIAPILEIRDGVAVLDDGQADKNPDWTVGGEDSGQWPAARLDVDAHLPQH